ncbi:hypothetical protein L7F22_018188 [Adiantum nelumboides]|nr:hypothetical protein [Adiantum nelumboides]
MREYWAAQKRKQHKAMNNYVTKSNTGEMDERNKRRICQSMVQHFDTLTVGMDASGRKEIFDELLQHSCFLTMQSKSKELEAIMLRNIHNTLNHVKVPRSLDEFFVKKSTMLMLVNGGSKEQTTHMSILQAAKLMGIHKKNLYSAKHHLVVSSESDGLFLASACHRDDAQRTHITQTVKDIVFQFWMDETRVSPNKKDVCSKRLARCSCVKHPIHLLEEPQVELYLRYKTKYADIQILQRCFESMKSFFVQKFRDRYTCYCIVHVQISLKSYQCSMGTCNACGVGNTQICIQEKKLSRVSKYL